MQSRECELHSIELAEVTVRAGFSWGVAIGLVLFQPSVIACRLGM